MRKIVSLTSIQYGVWITVDKMLDEKGFITAKDLAEFHGYTPRNARKYLKHFQHEGLLIARRVEKKWVWKRSGEATAKKRESVRITMPRETWERLEAVATCKGISKRELFQWILEKVTE